MDLQLVRKGLDIGRIRKKWFLLLGAFGITGYGAYKVYHLPSIAQKRKKLLKLLGALVSVAEAVSISAEAIGVVSSDMKEFLQSESDQIPNSLKQIAKLTKSKEFSESLACLTHALTAGILRGYQSKAKDDDIVNPKSSFLDQVMDKLFTTAGSGFASVVVGSLARNLVMAYYSVEQSSAGLNLNNSSGVEQPNLGSNSVPNWVNVVCGDKCRELIGDSIQLFVSTAVAVYLDKTMDINTYDELFTGLTNPKHETKVRDVLVSVCNGAIETLVRTSHEVLTSSDSNPKLNSSSGSHYSAIDQEHYNEFPELEASLSDSEAKNSFDEVNDGGWMSKLSSTLAVPSNRRLVLDVTGKVTFETVRSFLEFVLEKLNDGIARCVDSVHEAIVDTGEEVVRFVVVKSSVIATVCLSLCLHILGGVWVLVPA